MFVELSVKVVPSTYKFPSTFKSAPTHKFLPIPTPPSTRSAPVDVFVASVVLLRYSWFATSPPEKLLIVAAVIIGDPLIQPSCSKNNVLAPTPPLIAWTALPAIVPVLIIEEPTIMFWLAAIPPVAQMPAPLIEPPLTVAVVAVVTCTVPAIVNGLPAALIFVAVTFVAIKLP